MLLSASQESAVRECIETSSSGHGLQNLLLHGPKGVGKRSIARSIAAAAGLQLIEIPLSGVSAASLRQRLFGGADEAAKATAAGSAPGDAGIGPGSILFFSGLENLHPDFWQDFHRLLTTRKYVDGGGTEWALATDVWIIVGITTLVRQPQVDLSHWLCTAFHRRYGIIPIASPHELRSICSSIAKEISSDCSIDESVDSVFEAAPLPSSRTVISLRSAAILIWTSCAPASHALLTSSFSARL